MAGILLPVETQWLDGKPSDCANVCRKSKNARESHIHDVLGADCAPPAKDIIITLLLEFGAEDETE